MVKIDLITGFLGAGKTTFIKEYASYLLRQGLNIGILENDFGAVNVDMMLLQELQGEKCELEMISGGCDKETHRRRFKTKLISMAMCGYDRVIVEPSGIYDVDEFFDGLREEPLDRWYEIGSVITIVDAGLEENLSDQAEYLLGSEAADAGVIVLSRLDKDNACEEQENRIISHVNRSLERIGCTRRIEKEVIAKDWDMLTEEDFALAGVFSFAPYLRLLGFRKSAAPLLSAIKKNADIPLIAKLADAKSYLSDDACALLSKDIFAADVYRLALTAKTGKRLPNEFSHSPIVF